MGYEAGPEVGARFCTIREAESRGEKPCWAREVAPRLGNGDPQFARPSIAVYVSADKSTREKAHGRSE